MTQPSSVEQSACRWTFPWPTSVNVNQMYRRGPHGVYLAPAARDWKRTVTDTVIVSRQPLPPGPYRLWIVACPPPIQRRGARKRDLDGIVKPLQDAVFCAYGVDDAEVAELRVARDDGSAPGLCVLLGTLSEEETRRWTQPTTRRA